jgi:hypothetical protein
MHNQQNDILISKLIEGTTPLYHKDFPIILFWNPKCGCTTLAKWFYYHIGLLNQALAYSEWIHLYREEVYQIQPNYYRNLRNEILKGEKDRYKLVRNPYKRAVSSYVAGLLVPAILEHIESERKNGLSFKEFLYTLRDAGVERESINPHIALQYIDGEERFIQKYLKLEEFNAKIKTIEKKYHLKASPLEEIVKSPHHISQITDDSLTESYAEKNMLSAVLNNSGFPPYQKFYDAETKQLVKDLYQKDFMMFGYSIENFI